jgi:hypothetical protein
MSGEDFMFKKIAICSLTAAMFGASSVALAHTGFKDKVMEGSTFYTAITIGHGCGSATNDTPLPVIAQSVLFPNNADSVWSKLDANGNRVAALTIDKVVEGTILGITPGLVQDKSIFNRMAEVADSSTLVGAHPAPNVRAFRMWNGNLQTDLTGLVPFKIAAPKFLPTSCAKSLKIRVAIANWCKTSATNSADLTDKDRRADFWLGKPTAYFNDPKVVSIANPADTTVKPYWPTLTITRDTAANPLPPSCGDGFDAAVEPSVADINANLPMTGYPNGAL